MKGKSLFLMSIPALIAGIAMIITYRSISSIGVIITCGVLFIAAGAGSLLLMHGGGTRKAFTVALTRFTGAASILLGLSMLLFRETFTAIVPYMFGILVALQALYMFYILSASHERKVLPGWLYVLATALGGAAAYLFIQTPGPESDDSTIMLVTGISLTVFGLAVLLCAILAARSAGDAGNATPAVPDKEVPESPRPLDGDKDKE